MALPKEMRTFTRSKKNTIMKAWKVLSLLACVWTICIGFASCDDDEVDHRDVTGTWQMTHTMGYEINAATGEKSEWDTSISHGTHIELNADGTGLSGGEPFIWRLDDKNTLTVSCYGYTSTGIFVSINDSEMVVESSERTEDYTYYEEMTFHRLNTH